MPTAYPHLMALLSQKTSKAIDELSAKDSDITPALAFLDRNLPVFKQIKGFSERAERAFSDAIKSKESVEKFADFLAEVQVAELFLKADLLHRFEAPLPGQVQKGKDPSNCDLLAVVNGEKVWVEVKRIRRTRTEMGLEKQVTQIARIEKEVEKVPFPFVVILDLCSQFGPQDADRIIQEIIRELGEAFEELKTRPTLWPLRKIGIRLEDKNKKKLGSFDIHEKKGQFLQEEATTVLRCIPYSEKGSEQKKFLADLAGKNGKGAKLRELPKGEAGFIFFWVDSGTHEEIDLLGLLDGRLYILGDDITEQSRWQIDEFFKDYRKVTGVIMRTEHVIASVSSSGTFSYGPRDQKRFKIHWNPWAENKLSGTTATLLAELLG